MADGAAPLGHNHPPAETPFEAVRVHVEDLVTEARGWLDGEPVETQAQADAVSKLMDMLRKAKTAADNARKDEAKPFDDGKAEVQARYKPLIDGAETAVSTCKAALAPFLQAQEAARAAAVAQARHEAEQAAQQALEAHAAAELGSLEDREAVQAAEAGAKAAARIMKKVEKTRSHATGGARATTLRTHYTPVLIDAVAAARWAWNIHRPEMEEFITGLAKQRIAGGVRQIDGFDIVAEQRVV